MGNALVLFVTISAVLTVLGLAFTTPILLMFGAGADVLPYSREYLRIILLGTIFQCVGFGMNNFIRGEGNPNKAMSTMLIGAVLNVLLDPVFIFWLDMGIQGAAIATVISQACSSALVLWYFLRGGSVLRIRARAFNLQKRIVLDIMAIGSAPLPCRSPPAWSSRSSTTGSGSTADTALSPWASFQHHDADPHARGPVSQGAQPIIGYNYGAGNFSRVIRTIRLAALVATEVTLVGFVLAMLFPEQIIAAFSGEKPNSLPWAAALYVSSSSCCPLSVSRSWGQTIFRPLERRGRRSS